MPKRNAPNDISSKDDLNRLNEIVKDKRNDKRADDKKSRRNRHYEKQFIRNAMSKGLLNQEENEDDVD
jgi:hypothetical protein